MQEKSSETQQEMPRCIPCDTLDPSHLLSAEQLQEKVKDTLWTVEANDKNMPLLVRSFVTKNFQAALDCINAIGIIAEEQSHHPDLHLTNYREVRVVIYTHKLNGVTENDVALARVLDSRVKVDYSPKWLREHPDSARTAI